MRRALRTRGGLAAAVPRVPAVVRVDPFWLIFPIVRRFRPPGEMVDALTGTQPREPALGVRGSRAPPPRLSPAPRAGPVAGRSQRVH